MVTLVQCNNSKHAAFWAAGEGSEQDECPELTQRQALFASVHNQAHWQPLHSD